jgi:homoserine O-succinyltransferase/O-acetyltransferase
MPIVKPEAEAKVHHLRPGLRLVKKAPPRLDHAPALDIGLVNNMPDAALQATERQFMSLLNAAAGRGLVRLHFFRLPGVPRSAEAAARLGSIYADAGTLMRAPLDGLIVTGAEPQAADLRDEPYWGALTEMIDWAQDNTLSTIFSCLSAHAAVLHQDKIARRPLPEKCFGLFESVKLVDDPLLADLRWPLPVPHSRHNGLARADLERHGYRILTQAGEAGPDIFTRERQSLFVYLQGHPEYEPQSLQREYRRDVLRYLTGERDVFPVAPAEGLARATRASLEAFRLRAMAQRDKALADQCPTWQTRARLSLAQRDGATALFRNWLGLLAARKAR